MASRCARGKGRFKPVQCRLTVCSSPRQHETILNVLVLGLNHVLANTKAAGNVPCETATAAGTEAFLVLAPVGERRVVNRTSPTDSTTIAGEKNVPRSVWGGQLHNVCGVWFRGDGGRQPILRAAR